MKPILFNTEMVRAILENRKTATRRVVKPRYCDSVFEMFRGELCEASPYKPPIDNGDGTSTRFVRQYVPCKPPYRTGDILYVRETFGLYHQEPGFYVYKADEHIGAELDRFKWHPSIHMPREAARIFLRVTDVKVDRLQEIDDTQAVIEGAEGEFCNCDGSEVFCSRCCNTGWLISPRSKFSCIWDSTIRPKDRALYGWEANPWVWVIEFKRCEKPTEGQA